MRNISDSLENTNNNASPSEKAAMLLASLEISQSNLENPQALGIYIIEFKKNPNPLDEQINEILGWDDSQIDDFIEKNSLRKSNVHTQRTKREKAIQIINLRCSYFLAYLDFFLYKNYKLTPPAKINDKGDVGSTNLNLNDEALKMSNLRKEFQKARIFDYLNFIYCLEKNFKEIKDGTVDTSQEDVKNPQNIKAIKFIEKIDNLESEIENYIKTNKLDEKAVKSLSRENLDILDMLHSLLVIKKIIYPYLQAKAFLSPNNDVEDTFDPDNSFHYMDNTGSENGNASETVREKLKALIAEPAQKKKINPTDQVTELNFYHGVVKEDELIDLFKNAEIGAYLIRNSGHEGYFVFNYKAHDGSIKRELFYIKGSKNVLKINESAARVGNINNFIENIQEEQKDLIPSFTPLEKISIQQNQATAVDSNKSVNTSSTDKELTPLEKFEKNLENLFQSAKKADFPSACLHDTNNNLNNNDASNKLESSDQSELTVEKLEQLDYYYEKLSSTELDTKFELETRGSYLIRKSSSVVGHYALSYKDTTDNIQSELFYIEGSIAAADIDRRATPVSNIDVYIESLKGKRITLTNPLNKTPATKPEITKEDVKKLDYYYEITRENAKELLDGQDDAPYCLIGPSTTEGHFYVYYSDDLKNFSSFLFRVPGSNTTDTPLNKNINNLISGYTPVRKKPDAQKEEISQQNISDTLTNQFNNKSASQRDNEKEEEKRTPKEKPINNSNTETTSPLPSPSSSSTKSSSKNQTDLLIETNLLIISSLLPEGDQKEKVKSITNKYLESSNTIVKETNMGTVTPSSSPSSLGTENFSLKTEEITEENKELIEGLKKELKEKKDALVKAKEQIKELDNKIPKIDKEKINQEKEIPQPKDPKEEADAAKLFIEFLSARKEDATNPSLFSEDVVKDNKRFILNSAITSDARAKRFAKFFVKHYVKSNNSETSSSRKTNLFERYTNLLVWTTVSYVQIKKRNLVQNASITDTDNAVRACQAIFNYLKKLPSGYESTAGLTEVQLIQIRKSAKVYEKIAHNAAVDNNKKLEEKTIQLSEKLREDLKTACQTQAQSTTSLAKVIPTSIENTLIGEIFAENDELYLAQSLSDGKNLSSPKQSTQPLPESIDPSKADHVKKLSCYYDNLKTIDDVKNLLTNKPIGTYLVRPVLVDNHEGYFFISYVDSANKISHTGFYIFNSLPKEKIYKDEGTGIENINDYLDRQKSLYIEPFNKKDLSLKEEEKKILENTAQNKEEIEAELKEINKELEVANQTIKALKEKNNSILTEVTEVIKETKEIPQREDATDNDAVVKLFNEFLSARKEDAIAIHVSSGVVVKDNKHFILNSAITSDARAKRFAKFFVKHYVKSNNSENSSSRKTNLFERYTNLLVWTMVNYVQIESIHAVRVFQAIFNYLKNLPSGYKSTAGLTEDQLIQIRESAKVYEKIAHSATQEQEQDKNAVYLNPNVQRKLREACNIQAKSKTSFAKNIPYSLNFKISANILTKEEGMLLEKSLCGGKTYFEQKFEELQTQSNSNRFFSGTVIENYKKWIISGEITNIEDANQLAKSFVSHYVKSHISFLRKNTFERYTNLLAWVTANYVGIYKFYAGQGQEVQKQKTLAFKAIFQYLENLPVESPSLTPEQKTQIKASVAVYRKMVDLAVNLEYQGYAQNSVLEPLNPDLQKQLQDAFETQAYSKTSSATARSNVLDFIIKGKYLEKKEQDLLEKSFSNGQNLSKVGSEPENNNVLQENSYT